MLSKYRPLILSSIVVVFMLLFVLSMTSCANNGDVVVKLYDGENYIKEVRIANDKEYDFGKLEKVGYTFLGWYSENEGGIAYSDNKGSSAGMKWNINNSTDVYAHWEANRYTISLDYCGATAYDDVKEITVTYDAEIKNKLPVPQKTGATFGGWYTAEKNGLQITDSNGNFLDETKIYNISTYPMNDGGTILYANWGNKMVTYIFSLPNGEVVTQNTYAVGTVLQELPLAIKDNYCFEAWCFDQTMLSELKLPYTVADTETDVVMLYAKFSAGTIDILQFTTIPSTGDREYEVSYSGNAEKIVIPDSYYGKSVTRLRVINSSTVREVVLPQTIKEIINGAFEGCIALEKVNLPLNIETIPERCFSGCVKLNDIKIPQSVTSIKSSAFAGCSSIKEIELSANITTIGDGAFKNMTALKKFEIDENNSRYMVIEDVLYCKVGTSSYLVQYPLAKQGNTYNIDPSVTKILDYAFSNSELSSIVIGGKISTIGKGAFSNCLNLINIVILSDVVSFTIEDEAFANCTNLRAVKIEQTKVPTLSQTAFIGVSEAFSVYVTSNMVKNYQNSTNWRDFADKIYSLGTIYGDFAVEEVDNGYLIRQYFGTEKEVAIPEILNTKKIVGISANAFSFSTIEKVTISQHVVAIGDCAFKNCTNLNSIIMECVPPVLGEGVFENINADFGIYIKNTTDVLDDYRVADKWCDLSEHIWSYQ